MALVKQEREEELDSDAWLKQWSDTKQEIKEEDDIKPDLSKFEKNATDFKKEPLDISKKASKGNAKTVENVHSFQEKLECAPVSNEVANLCEYQCPKCKKIYKSANLMRTHFRVTKHVLLQRGELNKFLIKITSHQCLLCSKKLFCDKQTLLYHFVFRHKIHSLEEYSLKTKARYEGQCQNKRTIWNSSTLEKLLAKAPVTDKVGNLCVYQCQNCKKYFKSRNGITNHYKSKGNSCMADVNLIKNLTKVVAHKFHLCSKKVLCDIYVLKIHLLRHHQVKRVTDYCKISGLRNDGRFGKKISQKQKYELYQGKNSDQYKIAEKISNQCRFACNECDYCCNRWPLMATHIIRNSHGPVMSPTKYVTKATFHRCKICEELILCDTNILTTHLRIHQMTIVQYRTLTQTPDTQEVLKEYKSKLMSIIKNSHDDCQKLHATLKPNKNVLKDQKVTKHVGNISFYKCHVCNQSNFSYRCFKNHYQKEHKLKKKMCFKSQLDEAYYHRCHICSVILLCDNHIVGRHANKKHNMKFDEYCKHVVKNGGKVYPTFSDYKVNNQVFEPFMTDPNDACSNKYEGEDSGLILPGMISSESEASDEELN